MHNPRLAALVIALSLGSTSCFFRKPQRRVFVPPPPVAQPPLPTEAPQIAEPEITLPAYVADEALPEAARAAYNFPKLPAPPEPKRTPVVATPKPAPPTPPQIEPVPQPRIGQIFTADQRREYNKALDESLDRVRKVLGMVAGKSLNPEQSEIAERIRTFQKQAEQARDQDLVTAVNLARRADLLAQDLIGRLP